MLGRTTCTAAGGDAAPPAAEAAAAKPCGEKAIGEMPPSGSRMLRAGKVTQIHDRLSPAGRLSGQSHGWRASNNGLQDTGQASHPPGGGARHRARRQRRQRRCGWRVWGSRHVDGIVMA